MTTGRERFERELGHERGFTIARLRERNGGLAIVRRESEFLIDRARRPNGADAVLANDQTHAARLLRGIAQFQLA